MAQGFTRSGTDLVAALTSAERIVIAQLAGDVIELLADDGDVSDAPAEDDVFAQLVAGLERPIVRPQDPALLLLLPDGTDDPAEAAEFRRFTQDDLRDRKVTRLLELAHRMLDCEPVGDGSELHDLVIAADDAPEMAAAMTDIRVVLASRIGIADDDSAQRLYEELVKSDDETRPWPDEYRDDPAAADDSAVRGFMVAAFALLGALQESLTDRLYESLPPPSDGPIGGNR